MTLGSALRAHVRLIAWCKACRHQIEPEIATQVERYGPSAGAGMGGTAALL